MLEKNRQIKFGLDGRMIAHSGIGTYIRGLLSELAADSGKELDLTLYGQLEKLTDYSAKKVSATFPIYSLREQFFFPSLLRKNKEANLHVPHYNAPLGFKGNLIVTIHDLIHLRYPPSRIAYFYARTMLTAVCKKAKAIIAVSNATKNDLVKMLDVKEAKIRVIYSGAGSVQQQNTSPSPRIKYGAGSESSPLKGEDSRLFPSPLARTGELGEGEGEGYLLYVGMLKPHKNIKVLIEAFLKAKERISNLKLVIAGKNFMPDYTEQFKERKEFQFLGEVSYKKLKQLYSGARLFVFPSLYEGFGFPPLEAMSYGVPVISSNAASLPEVAGDAAVFFDPQDAGELAQKICELWESRSQKEDLVKKGFEQVKKFSWKKCANEVQKLYAEVFT